MRVRSQRCVPWSAGSTPSVSHSAARAVAEALEDLDGGGLAGAVGPEEREDLALLHLEADVAHRHGVPVGLGQVLHADRRHRDHAPRDEQVQNATALGARRVTAVWLDAPAPARTPVTRPQPPPGAPGGRPRYLLSPHHLVEEVAELAQLGLREGRERRRRHREHPVDLVASARPASVRTMIFTRRSSGAGSRRARPLSSRSSTSAVM